MKNLFQASIFAAVVSSAVGCASPERPDAAESQQLASECAPTIGSNICRKGGTGAVGPVKSISGDDLRRAGGAITNPRTSRIGD